MPFYRSGPGGPGRRALPIAEKARIVSARLTPDDIAFLAKCNVSPTQALREVVRALRESQDETEPV